jgi:adenylate cyclase
VSCRHPRCRCGGYSRLIEANEKGSLERLPAIRVELIDPAIAAHHGRIVKTTGDGLLAELASTVAALRCASEIRPAWRIGTRASRSPTASNTASASHTGDILKDSDIFGHGSVRCDLRLHRESGERPLTALSRPTSA